LILVTGDVAELARSDVRVLQRYHWFPMGQAS
jgi:hypothetical protein